MKKLYLFFLALLLLFIPGTHAIAVYQLDQPLSELNGHTLREVFDEGNVVINGDFSNGVTGWTTDSGNTLTTYYEFGSNSAIVVNSSGGQLFNINQSVQINSNHNYYVSLNVYNGVGNDMMLQVYSFPYESHLYAPLLFNGVFNHYSTDFTKSEDSPGVVFAGLDLLNSQNGLVSFKNIKIIDKTLLGIESLTKQQMDKYYDLYVEAVRFESENIEASQDSGGYQNLFKSIINGVKGLMIEMHFLWEWLNAPIITSDMSDYSFNIDWSWDLMGVVRQIMNSAGRLVLQILFWVPSLAFTFMGIPIQISILSLLFSNLIFLLLGWIMVKSFLI